MDHRTDFALLIVVPEAWTAVLALFGEPTEHRHASGQDWALWDLEVSDGGQVRVVVDATADRGDLAAQEAAALIIETWRPRYLLLADIGGGFKGRDGLEVGDLVVAGDLEYYSLVKEVGGLNEPRSLPIAAPDRGLFKDLGGLHRRVPGWTTTIPVARPAMAHGTQPKLLPGQVVVGERLLADPKSPTVAELAARYPKALAVDMESVGLARAVLGAQQKTLFTQYGVLRGISDLVDDPELDNQDTRDNAKPYAAAVAIAAANAHIRIYPSSKSILNATEASTPPRPHPYFDRYLELLRRVLATRPVPKLPFFRLPLRSTSVQIEGSIAPAPDTPIERGELLDIAEHDRLVAVIGRSGVGKSELLNAAARQLAAADDPVVVRIDLKSGWSRVWAKAMPEKPYGPDLDPSMDALLNAASPPLTVEQLNAFIAGGRRIALFVDAINEVPPEAAEKIRLTLGQYARHHPDVQVLATDRVAERDYREMHWTVLDLPVLPPTEARRIIDAKFGLGCYADQPQARREILRIPFFLDRALTQGTVSFTSRADLVSRFLENAHLTSTDVAAAGEVALDVLLRGESVFSESDQNRLRKVGALEKLREGGFVIEGDSGLVFSHQLIHQYFAGKQVAANPSLWRPEVMDALTVFATSLDGVGMVVKAIEDLDGRDKFLHIIYDWNWWAGVLALSEARSGDRSVSEATEQAILAMASAKRFDPVEGTRSRISALLANVEGPVAAQLREIEEEELFRAVSCFDHPEISWWAEWKKVFLARDPAVVFGEKMIDRLVSEMPLIGWMTSNTLRRAQPPDEVSEAVRQIYSRHPDKTAPHRAIRWRVLHTLGAWPATDNAALLADALSDEHVWCRYGAVRSLVEMAARTHDHQLRDRIISHLHQGWRYLDARPLWQIGWASLYEDADAAWPSAIKPLLEEIRDFQQNIEERQRWNRRVAAFERYARKHALRRA